jgi:general secretion pathway protein D
MERSSNMIIPYPFYVRLLLVVAIVSSTAQALVSTAVDTKANTSVSTSIKKQKYRKKYIAFNFDNEDLVTIINYLAAEKGVNIILPTGTHQITAKVSLKHQEKLTIDEAFTMLYTLLDVAGYTMQQKEDTYIIAKLDAHTTREALPVYIGVNPEQLPASDERIRYLYYFENIKIPPGNTAQAQEIKTILEDMLHEQGKQGASNVLFDSVTNSVILSGKSYAIKIAMQVIRELDKTGFREVIEVIRLINTSASFVARFLMEQLINLTNTEKPTPNFVVGPPGTDTSFFSKTTKIFPDQRTNSLIILGRTKAVERLKDFIFKYIDIPLESGESIIHVYDLQYLDAQTFAADLVKIIKPQEIAGQAKGATADSKLFNGVIIEAERVGTVQKLNTQIGEVGDVFQGGNRLVIAAKKNDWIAIKKLIDDLDKPQPQVALEVLVADISLDSMRELGSQIRNKQNAFPPDMAAQAANLGSPVLDNPATTLATNLLLLNNGTNLANNATPGSLIFSFNDASNNGIWLVSQILSNYTNSRILSHPHIITLNQKQAKVTLAQTRLVQGPAKPNPDGTVAVQVVEIPADLQVEILPRINLSNSINLQIAVHVNSFTNPTSTTDNTRNTRTVITNATVGNGEILVLGGLIQTTEDEDITETLPFSKIPILGWFFKDRTKTVQKDNLMIFICPTVVKPKIGGGMDDATTSKFIVGKKFTENAELFDQLRDPITRWFFKSPPQSVKDTVHEYERGIAFADQSEVRNTVIKEKPCVTDDKLAQPRKRRGLGIQKSGVRRKLEL